MLVKYTYNCFNDFCINANFIYLCYEDKFVVKADTNTGLVETLCKLPYIPDTLLFFKNQLIVSDGYTIGVWNTITGTLNANLYHSNSMKSLKVSTNSLYFMERDTRKIYQLSTYGIVKQIVDKSSCVAFDVYDEFMFVMSSDELLSVYDLEGTLFHEYSVPLPNAKDILAQDEFLYITYDTGFEIINTDDFSVVFRSNDYYGLTHMKQNGNAVYYLCNHIIYQVNHEVITQFNISNLKPQIPDVDVVELTTRPCEVFLEKDTTLLCLLDVDTNVKVQDLKPEMSVRILDKGYFLIKQVILHETPEHVYTNGKVCISTNGKVHETFQETQSNQPFYRVVLHQNNTTNIIYLNDVLTNYYNFRK